jgi:hypothetical protein
LSFNTPNVKEIGEFRSENVVNLAMASEDHSKGYASHYENSAKLATAKHDSSSVRSIRAENYIDSTLLKKKSTTCTI